VGVTGAPPLGAVGVTAALVAELPPPALEAVTVQLIWCPASASETV
jgi:hypothetical protein